MRAEAMRDNIPPLRARILRAWRHYENLSVSELAARTRMGTSTLSMLEHGSRGRRPAASLDTVRSIARSLELSDDHTAALIDLWTAADSVKALPPRVSWAHNFPGSKGPAWVWLRPASHGSTTAQLRWGMPLAKLVASGKQPSGALVQFPASVPAPAFDVTLSQPGWADFGRGVVPPDVAQELGIRPLNARDLSAAHHEWWSMDWVADWGEGVPVGHWRSDGAAQPQRDSRPAAGPLYAEPDRDSRGILVSQCLMTPQQAQRLREARGLGREAAAAAATELTESSPITARMILTIESHRRARHEGTVLARLDTVYRADGRLGIERTFISEPSDDHSEGIDVSFPDFWWGPVWLQFVRPRLAGPAATEPVCAELAWGLGGSEQLVRPGAVLSMRNARPGAGPLRIRVPSGWVVAAGTGAVPGAHDIRHDWHPVSSQAKAVILRNLGGDNGY